MVQADICKYIILSDTDRKKGDLQYPHPNVVHRNQRVLEVRAEIQQSFVEEIYRRMSRTVWQSGGCKSWYQDQTTGEITTLWPGSVVSYLRRMRAVSPSDYELRAPMSAT